MNRNVITSMAVHGRLAKQTENEVPIAGELDDKSNLFTLAHAVSIWTRTSKSYTTFIAKIIPSNLNTCKINEIFNFNAMKKIGIDTTHVFHCGISYIFKCPLIFQ